MPWSGVDLVTEYPVCSGSEDSEDDAVHDPAPVGIRSPAEAAEPPGGGEIGGIAATREVSRPSDSIRRIDPGEPTTEQAIICARESPALSSGAVPQDPWRLAGPVDGMSGLPVAVSKQTAVLIHACECSPEPPLWPRVQTDR